MIWIICINQPYKGIGVNNYDSLIVPGIFVMILG